MKFSILALIATAASVRVLNDTNPGRVVNGVETGSCVAPIDISQKELDI